MKPIIHFVDEEDIDPILILSSFNGNRGWINLKNFPLPDNKTFKDLGYEVLNQIDYLGETLVNIQSSN